MDWPVESLGWDIQEAWVQSAANALAWGIFGWGVLVGVLVLLTMWAIRVRRRRFWCEGVQREVEVDFEERGLPGFQRPTAVLSCSVFDPPTAVSCRRECLDPDARVRVPIARRLRWRSL